MKGKDNNKRAEPALESNSMELFEEIFKQATMEIRIEKEGRAQKQKYTPVLAPSRGLRQELKAAEKKVIKQSKPAAEGAEKAQGSPALTRTAPPRRRTPPPAP